MRRKCAKVNRIDAHFFCFNPIFEFCRAEKLFDICMKFQVKIDFSNSFMFRDEILEWNSYSFSRWKITSTIQRQIDARVCVCAQSEFDFSFVHRSISMYFSSALGFGADQKCTNAIVASFSCIAHSLLQAIAVSRCACMWVLSTFFRFFNIIGCVCARTRVFRFFISFVSFDFLLFWRSHRHKSPVVAHDTDVSSYSSHRRCVVDYIRTRVFRVARAVSRNKQSGRARTNQ